MKNFLLSILLFSSFCGFSQTATLGSPTINEYAASVIADDAGSTYIGGSSGVDLWIVKRNSLGTTEWSRNLLINGVVSGADISNMLKIGDTLFGSVAFYNSTGFVSGGAYFKMNATTGTCYWLKYNTTNNVYYSSVQYYQGKLILSGSRAPSSTSIYDGKVIAVSSTTGNTIWETPFFGLKFLSTGADYIDDFYASTTVENGKMYLSGRSYVDGAPENMRITLIGIDVDNGGSIFLSKYLLYDISTDFSRVYGYSIKRDGPNDLVIAFSGDYLCSTCSNFRSGLVKCDLNGNVTWAKYYDINGASEELCRTFNVTPDGYVIYGQAKVGNESRISLLKTDKQGNFLLGKFVGQPNTNVCVRGSLVNAGGRCDFRNNVHHFTGNKYTNINQRDAFYLKANNSDLEGDNSCYTYENFTVNTTVVPPHSGNLIVNNSALNLSYQNTFSEANATSATCPDIQVTTTHSNDCGKDSIVVSISGITNPQYTWSNGATGLTVVTTTTDTLFLSIHNPATCCSYEEMIIPSFQPMSGGIDVQLPADMTVCLDPGETVALNPVVTPSQSGVNFTWNSGETTANIDVAATGTYIVHAYVGCSEDFDTIQVTVNHTPELDLGPDLQLCLSQLPFVLETTDPSVTNWQWSTGETTPTISVSNYGLYSVTVSNTCGSDSDSMVLSELEFPEIAPLPSIDTCIAPGLSVLLSAAVSSSASSVLWNTGSTGFEIGITESGTYSITATNNCGTVSESSQVIINHPFVDTIPELITSCVGYIQLSDFIDSSFEVSSFEVDLTDDVIEDSGWIYFTLENSCGTYTDSALISITSLDLFYLQNSFTPNGDGINDRFDPRTSDLAFQQVEIYNRWGERIFHEEGGFHGWDGTHKGNKCPDGIYQVMVLYSDCNGINVQFNGHVVLLR